MFSLIYFKLVVGKILNVFEKKSLFLKGCMYLIKNIVKYYSNLKETFSIGIYLKTCHLFLHFQNHYSSL